MKLFGKRYCVVVLIIILSSLAAGCGFKDIDKRLFVVSIGIDPANDSSKKYLVSLKFAIPIIEEKSNESMIVSEEADTISEAVRMIKTRVDKEIDFSHAKVIVYNQKVLQQEIEPNLYYWFIRRRDIQEVSWVAIGEPSALDVLKLKPKSERLPSNSLFLALGRDGPETAYIIPEFLFDFKRRFNEKGIDPFLPIIEVKENSFTINTVGLLTKKQLKLQLKPKETMILNFLLNNESKSALVIDKKDKRFVIDTKRVKSKYKIFADNQKQPYIKFDITINGRIEEADFPVNNMDIPEYEKSAKKLTEENIYQFLVKMQKGNVDPVGFGLHYRARHFEKNDWETWQKLYPAIKFKVNVDIQIEDTGLVE
ncbi:Ger(x)C family spore germination protein [Neobacillus niacini]|uniref:Ger(x)C family spore germination protein n=1 Tax=Neobacillus niacini TaxID=86668 RepID=UPI003983B3F2